MGASVRTKAASQGKKPAAGAGWRRADEDQSLSQQLGERIRAVRENKGLSLSQLSERCGIPRPTLSRIENSRMSPTFGVLARVMVGLDVDWVDVVGPTPHSGGERLASFADVGSGRSATVRESKATLLHSHDDARALPILVDIRAKDLAEAGGLIGHRGEEFCYVLSGVLVLHMEGMPPRILKAGASALFDSAIPHTYLTGTKAGTRVLLVVVRDRAGAKAPTRTLPS